MIIITGAAGFIGSCLVAYLNAQQIFDLILVDDFTNEQKNKNIQDKSYLLKIDRFDFFDWFKAYRKPIKCIFHMGARTDTTEMNAAVLNTLNLAYSKKIWQVCSLAHIPLVYASSAATYGDGSQGYSDKHSITHLKPLNPYGWSKQKFDLWALKQAQTPPYWYGLKFFNVYGPNEYHKGRMASVVWHTFNQIKQTGSMRLFKSHHPLYKNGMQMRDFIYVKELIQICYFLYTKKHKSGIYNVGTGTARTFKNLAEAVFNAMNYTVDIKYIDIPEKLKNQYQYFTQADMQKLQDTGYQLTFTQLEQGIEDYVHHYLLPKRYL